MFTGGNATIYVADFERAVAFYTETLGLKLRFRAENHWAEVVAGKDLVIGIHPAGPHTPQPGAPGAIHIGLVVDRTLEEVMETLTARGVTFDGPIVEEEKAPFRFAHLRDPEGTRLYLWETVAAPG